jgi:hypothetical protein
MSREIGGRADKDGNEFEKLWVVSLAFRVVQGEATSLIWEPLGLGAGIELCLVLPDHSREVHQCKIENGTKGRWTAADLSRVGVLEAARDQLQGGQAERFVFVSRDPARVLRDLAERANNCDNNAAFFKDYSLSSRSHQKEFESLCKIWGLDQSKLDDVTTALSLLKGLSFEGGIWDRQERKTLERQASFFAEGEGSNIVSRFGDSLWEKHGNDLHADQLREELRRIGFPPRDLVGDRLVADGIERLQKKFENSLSSFLIGDALIPRPETQEILETLEKPAGPRILFVHGDAGGGKSGVLLELCRSLREAGTPFLYEQTEGPSRSKCLDAWDTLLRSRVGISREQLHKLDV